MASIHRPRLEARLSELRQAEYELMAQLHAVQGAINEIEKFWLPWIDEQQANQGESRLEPIEYDPEIHSNVSPVSGE